MVFGQFVDHDLDHVPVQRRPDDEGFECCPNGRQDRSLPGEVINVKEIIKSLKTVNFIDLLPHSRAKGR